MFLCLHRPSQLGSIAGDGLFATVNIPQGSVICQYRGKTLDTHTALRVTNKFVVSLTCHDDSFAALWTLSDANVGPNGAI